MKITINISNLNRVVGGYYLIIFGQGILFRKYRFHELLSERKDLIKEIYIFKWWVISWRKNLKYPVIKII